MLCAVLPPDASHFPIVARAVIQPLDIDRVVEKLTESQELFTLGPSLINTREALGPIAVLGGLLSVRGLFGEFGERFLFSAINAFLHNEKYPGRSPGT